MRPFVLFLILLLVGCSPKHSSQTDDANSKPVVIALNYPLASAANILAGEDIELKYPISADVDPAYWKPTESDVIAMQDAALLLLNGAGHEPWTSRVTLSPLNQTNTSLGFREQWIKTESEVTHSHGPEGKHTHAVLAHTTWLDPHLFSEQLRVIALSLEKLLPEDRSEIEARLNDATTRLKKLDAAWEEHSERWGPLPLLASHPVYQYPARRYQWNLKSVHWEPGESPTPQQWQEFDELLKTHPAKTMLWEDDPLPETRQQLADRGIQVVVIKTLANGDPNVSILDAMEENLQQAVSESAPVTADPE